LKTLEEDLALTEHEFKRSNVLPSRWGVMDYGHRGIAVSHVKTILLLSCVYMNEIEEGGLETMHHSWQDY